jgi:DNA-binding MarR family transcriptional regulator
MVPEKGNFVETAKLLDNIGSEEASNQRALARRIGVSVGLVNALVHRAVHKGLIKIKEAPARRYAYYLTPKGFAEKSRLIAQYLDHSLSFFRTARQEYSELFARCKAAGNTRIVLCGAGELAEIATLSAFGTDVELVAVLDAEITHARVTGLPVVRDIAALDPDAVLVITDGRRPQDVYDTVTAAVGRERVHAPPFLRITPRSLHVFLRCGATKTWMPATSAGMTRRKRRAHDAFQAEL